MKDFLNGTASAFFELCAICQSERSIELSEIWAVSAIFFVSDSFNITKIAKTIVELDFPIFCMESTIFRRVKS